MRSKKLLKTFPKTSKTADMEKKSQVKSSYYSPQSKEQNPQQAEQGHAQMQQCV
jgi:hypothetical protein